MAKKKSAYAQAGVDIDEMMSSLTAVKRHVRSTKTEANADGGVRMVPLFPERNSRSLQDLVVSRHARERMGRTAKGECRWLMWRSDYRTKLQQRE